MTSAENLLEFETEMNVQQQKIRCTNVIYEEGKNRINPNGEPKDTSNIARITMYLFGIACLLPWNFFIQANDYWLYKLRDVDADGSTTPPPPTDLQVSFPSYLAIASKVPYVIFLLVNTALANRISAVKRMHYPLIVMIALFVVVVVIVPINTDNHQTAFFVLTMCIVVGINVMCGFVQGSGTGIAGSFPKVYMEHYVNGMAVGGILASFAQILSLVVGTSPVVSALIYFISATVILCITFTMFRVLIRTGFYQFYMSKQTSSSTDNIAVKRSVSQFEILKKIWVNALSVMTLFWVTLSLLPAVVSQVSSTSDENSIWTGKLFLPVACFFLFNACDLGGRIIATQMPIPSKCSYLTMALTISRAVFIPLLMFCNATPRKHLPIVFDSDLSFIIIIFFFALSNGYLCNIILSQAPKKVEEDHQEVAGTQMAAFLGFGLMLGSVSSYGIIKLL